MSILERAELYSAWMVLMNCKESEMQKNCWWWRLCKHPFKGQCLSEIQMCCQMGKHDMTVLRSTSPEAMLGTFFPNWTEYWPRAADCFTLSIYYLIILVTSATLWRLSCSYSNYPGNQPVSLSPPKHLFSLFFPGNSAKLISVQIF